MMNAYFFQMNNLKGLAADESGSSVLVERMARSNDSQSDHLWPGLQHEGGKKWSYGQQSRNELLKQK